MWQFFKDFLIYGFSSILGKIIAIFLIPIYTSILTKEEYGVMALFTSFSGVIDVFANLNIHSGIAREYYEVNVNRKKLVSTGFFSILGISLFVLCVLLIFRNSIYTEIIGLNDHYLLTFVVMLMIIPANSLQSYFSILTRYKKKALLFSVGSLIHLLLITGLSVYGVVFLRLGILAIFAAQLVGAVFSFIYYGLLNRDLLSISFEKKYIKNALKFSLPTLPAILAGWADNSLGQIIIGKYVSLSSLGVYSIALSVSSVFSLITIAFMNVWSPFLYENYKKEEFKIQVQKLFKLFVLLLMSISLLLSIFSKEIILILTNPSYLEACKYITLLCIPMCFYLLFPIVSSGVSISRETKYIGLSYVFGSLLNIVSLVVFIEYLGVLAIPLCLAASRIFTYFFLYGKSQNAVAYDLPNHWLLALLFIVVCCYYIIGLELNVWIRIVMTIICLIGILIKLNSIIQIKEVFCLVKRKFLN